MKAPKILGRSVVVADGAAPPAQWMGSEVVIIDQVVLADPARLAATVVDLQRSYVRREPLVFDLRVDPAELARVETTDAQPYELGERFTFLRPRLQKAVWHNSYDARKPGEPVWWWAHKAAARFAFDVGGSADVVDEEGTAVWIDGGPRQLLEIEDPVIHHESVDLGHLAYVPEAFEHREGLAPDQAEAVAHGVGPARIIAPAGSGKTRVLTTRLRHLLEDRGFEPEIVTAVAYNKRAAGEMVSRLPEGERLNVRTIHSLGWGILRMARPGVRLLDEPEQRRRVETIAPAPRRTNTDVIGPYIEALDEVRIGLRDPEHVEASRDDTPGFVDVFGRYRDGLDQRNEADHSEQIYAAIESLCRDPELRLHWQAQCQHMLVDEFQDLTPAYLLLIRLLASPGLDVFGVGDDDQVIYGYAGADPEFLINFEDLFPGAGEHALEVNYRCPSDVVAGASTLLAYNLRRVDKTIEAASQAVGLQVVKRPGNDLADEAVKRIEGLIADGVAPSDIAVLTRVNSSLLPVHVALAEKGIPIESRLGQSVLDRTLLRGALAWLRIALDTSAIRRNDLFEAIRRPQRGLNRLLGELLGRRRGPFGLNELIEIGQSLDGRRFERWNDFCEDILTASRSTETTSELLDVLSEEVGLDRAASALDAGRTRADRSAQGDDLTALRRVAAMAPGPLLFESWLRAHLDTRSDSDGVVLSTVHRVKGMEWDHVVVFGVDRGSMPHALSEDVEEERRIFHVALTRGSNSVSVLADEDRPSRFLTELDGSAPLPRAEPTGSIEQQGSAPADGVYTVVGDELEVTGGFRGTVAEVLTTGVLISVKGSGATMAVPWGERVTKSGDTGRLAPGRAAADDDLVEKLKTWRLDQAQRQGVPAYVVFNDRTLEALASMRPTTEEAMLAVPGIGPAKLENYGDDLLDLLG